MLAYLLFTICFFSSSFSHSHMMKGGNVDNTFYGLICPDESLAVGNGLHACCENPPFNYCVLCVLLTKPSDHIITTCTTECNGTLLHKPPYCEDCVCRAPSATTSPAGSNEADLSTKESYRGCPFLNRKGKYKDDL